MPWVHAKAVHIAVTSVATTERHRRVIHPVDVGDKRAVSPCLPNTSGSDTQHPFARLGAEYCQWYRRREVGQTPRRARRLRRCHVVGGAGRNVTLGMMGGHVVQGMRGVAREWMGGRGKGQTALRLNNRRSAFILSVTLARSADMMGARVASCPLCSFLHNLKALRLDRAPSVTRRGAPQIERQRVLPHGTELPARKTSSPPSARGLQYLFTPRAAGVGTSHVSRHVTRACINDAAHCSGLSHPSATDGCRMSFRPQAQFHQLSLPLPSDHQLSASPLAHLRTTLFDRLLVPR